MDNNTKRLRQCFIFRNFKQALSYSKVKAGLIVPMVTLRDFLGDMEDIRKGCLFALKDEHNEIEEGHTINLAIDDAYILYDGRVTVTCTPVIRISGHGFFWLSEFDADKSDIDAQYDKLSSRLLTNKGQQ